MGGFWANIAKVTTAKGNSGNRSDLNHARMQLLQQLLAALLNKQAFGADPGGTTLVDAGKAFCSTDSKSIQKYAGILGSSNEANDGAIVTPGVAAQSQAAKAAANLIFWDTSGP